MPVERKKNCILLSKKTIKGIPVEHLVLFLMVIMSLGSIAVMKSGWLFIIVMYAMAIYYMIKQNESTVIFFAWCCVLQNIICIVFSPYLKSSEVTLLLCVKEFLVYFSFLYYVIRRKKIYLNEQTILFLGFIFLVLMSFVVRDVPFKYQVTGFRQLALPFFCYLFGKSLNINSDGLHKLYKSILIISVSLAVIGLIIYCCPNGIWDKIGYQTFFKTKNGVTENFGYENFYTFDLASIFGRVKRLVSYTADPLATAHILAIGMIIALIVGGKWNICIAIVLGLALILGISKSILIIAAVALLIIIYINIKTKKNRNLFKALCFLLGVLFVGYMIFIYSAGTGENSSIGNHYSSLIAGIRDMSLLGNGLGTAGYTVVLSGNENAALEYTESFFAVTSAQIGFAGILCVYGFLLSISRRLYNKYKSSGKKEFILGMIFVLSIAAESLVSASSVSMVGSSLYFILAGVFLNGKIERVDIDEKSRNNNSEL